MRPSKARPSRSASQFASEGYLRINGVLRKAQAHDLCAYAFAVVGPVTFQSEKPYGKYGAPVADRLLRDLLPIVQGLVSIQLYPAYSYLRIYLRGHALARHHDRSACEISLSVTLGQETSHPWPLWIRGFQSTTKVSLRTGDAVLYRGVDCEHWRNRFRGKWQCQLFLHYVDRNGPYANWKFDRRPRLGLPVWMRHIETVPTGTRNPALQR